MAWLLMAGSWMLHRRLQVRCLVLALTWHRVGRDIGAVQSLGGEGYIGEYCVGESCSELPAVADLLKFVAPVDVLVVQCVLAGVVSAAE